MKSYIIVAILLAVGVAVNANLPAVCKDPESVYSHNAGHVWDMKATCGRYRCNDLGYVQEETCQVHPKNLPWYCSIEKPKPNSKYPFCCEQIRCTVH